MKTHKEDKNFTRYLGLMGVPFILVAAPICGYLLGYGLDKLLNTKPYLSYLFLFFGVVACIREFYNVVKKLSDDDQSSH